MSAKAIREYTGKEILSKFQKSPGYKKTHCVSVVIEDPSTLQTLLDDLPKQHEWLLNQKLVVKVDQLIKRRGKLGLLEVDVNYDTVKKWIKEKSSKDFVVGSTSGRFDSFIIEPFIKHNSTDEYYLSIISTRTGNNLLFYEKGGIDVGDVDLLARKIEIPISTTPSVLDVIPLLINIPKERKETLSTFITELFTHYDNLNFTYLEINPLVMVNNDIYVLDLAAKLDETAEFECSMQWGPIDFPPPFGRCKTKEEAYVAELDSKSGASLKLTILNPEGRIWTMVAGGGASVIYSDTICDLGGANELANYGEYSGAPTEGQTYEYAKTILTLMTKKPHPKGKLLLIGGGIANFTNVATTFKGIERVLKEFSEILKEQNIKIFVRRGGPNYEEGLSILRSLGENFGISIQVFGPESHMTAIVSLALGLEEKQVECQLKTNIFSTSSLSDKVTTIPTDYFTSTSRSIVFGLQNAAVQRMLDFDHACHREKPSVAAMVYPFSENHMEKFYWGRNEFLLPCFKSIAEAAQNNSDTSVFINFSSFRSAFQVTMESLEFPQFRVMSIIAEGIPERRTKIIIKKASEKNVLIIGPATVGGIKAGCFRIGNTGGSMDNILASKLYRPGSVAYVSKSGGMSNELNNIISRTTDGIYEGVAIGGDRYPGSTFLDHLLRYQSDPHVKCLVLLGEVGGVEEYSVCKAIQDGKITKPLIAWCIGTCGSMFNSEVQFGHAGAFAQGEIETARAKNIALRNAGAHVPNSFNELGNMISAVYKQLIQNGIIIPKKEPEVPKVPIDYSWAQELGLIRKPTSFISTISDERGEELTYNGLPVSTVLEQGLGIGGVIGLLWFKRQLPNWAGKFIETCLVITADHGPAVSGAHNTIVAARAGKDLVSSLASGLLTIGDRFGGALDAAAQQFSEGFDKGLTPAQFVESLRKENKLIMGIGHRVKSINNPDKRVELIKEFAKNNFPQTPLLSFALKVEALTVAKKPNLILNVDGAIACCFVDLLRNCGTFTESEAKEYIQLGFLNGLFVLGRTIGFVGHYLDQKRLKQGLYRHSWDDISYSAPEYTQF